MAIKELTTKSLGKSKAGWTWDRKREVFFTFQIDTSFNGDRYIRRGFRSEKAAADHIETLKTQERLKKIGVVQMLKFPKVSELFEKHLSTIESKRARTSFKRITAKFLTVLPSQNLTLDDLTRKHFKDYCDRRIADGIKAESANREITDLSSAIHKAGDYFENLENWNIPEKLIYRPSFETSERSRVISSDERARLINHLLSERRPNEKSREFTARRRAGLVLYFALLTGLRHGEICDLKKSNLDRKARSLRAERFKTKKKGVSISIFAPLTVTQLWVLDEAAKLHSESEFFFSTAGKKP